MLRQVRPRGRLRAPHGADPGAMTCCHLGSPRRRRRGRRSCPAPRLGAVRRLAALRPLPFAVAPAVLCPWRLCTGLRRPLRSGGRSACVAEHMRAQPVPWSAPLAPRWRRRLSARRWPSCWLRHGGVGRDSGGIPNLAESGTRDPSIDLVGAGRDSGDIDRVGPESGQFWPATAEFPWAPFRNAHTRRCSRKRLKNCIVPPPGRPKSVAKSGSRRAKFGRSRSSSGPRDGRIRSMSSRCWWIPGQFCAMPG